MILLSAIVYCLGGMPVADGQKSIYSQVVQHPDPNNGYEDYLRGADLARDWKLSMCLDWSPGRDRDILERKKLTWAQHDDPDVEWTALDEARLQWSKRLDDLGYLGVQRLAVGQWGRAIDLVRAGNQKQVWDPRD